MFLSSSFIPVLLLPPKYFKCRCTHILDADSKPKVFSLEDKDNMIKDVIMPMASHGLRTLCLAYRDIPEDEEIDWEEENNVVSNLTCVTIVGIEDPVRPEVLDTNSYLNICNFWILFQLSFLSNCEKCHLLLCILDITVPQNPFKSDFSTLFQKVRQL